MVIFMKEILKIIYNKEMECYFIIVVQYIQVNLQMENQMEMEKKFGQMDHNMKVNLRMVKKMVKVYINGVRDVYMMDNGKII